MPDRAYMRSVVAARARVQPRCWMGHLLDELPKPRSRAKIVMAAFQGASKEASSDDMRTFERVPFYQRWAAV